MKTFRIKSGYLNKRYTLQELRSVIGDSGYPEMQYKFACVLSSDKDKAIKKAFEITGEMLTIDFEVDETESPSVIDWSVFQAGKYQGISAEKVCTDDPDYVIFLIKQGIKSYEKTLEICKKHPVIIAKLTVPVEQPKFEEKPVVKPSEYVGIAGSKIELEIKHIETFGFDTNFGRCYISKFEDRSGNILVYKGNSVDPSDFNGFTESGFTVKKHSEYQGVRQTEIIRVKAK